MDSEVLIAGAGPTGLTLACDLLRRGVTCRIIDIADGPFTGSRAFTLKPRSVAVLDGLLPGTGDRIRAAGRLDVHLQVHFGSEKLFGLDVPADPDPARNSVGLPQYRTEEILRDVLHRLGGAVEFGVGIAEFDDDGTEVTARLTDGTTHTARFLVGADGGRSTVRRALGIAFEGRSEEMSAQIADVPIEGLDRADGVHLWMLPAGMVAARPIPHDTHWQLVIGGGAAAREAAFRGRDITVGEPRWESTWRYNARLAAAYGKGNVFVCGDAAHVHSPFGGHGMNTGIQDAANLGWKLGLVLRGGAGRELLDTYEAERRPVGQAILEDSDKQRSAFLPPRFLRPLLRFMLRRVLSRTHKKDRNSYPRYPEGGLIGKGGGDVAGYEGRDFTLLAGGDVPKVKGFEFAVRPGKPGRFTLIRPDGYVAIVTSDPAALAAHVTSIFMPAGTMMKG